LTVVLVLPIIILASDPVRDFEGEPWFWFLAIATTSISFYFLLRWLRVAKKYEEWEKKY